ncbi:MAG: Hsp20/alpha crystallin family protein [Candidatus Thermoplasmatota archaeon]|jgi:HSP20 family protein|nr:Hsp20/alpha crystallin family protein [Candidatus Thermoplasmatota archaeon]MCL5789261.1 Hsp20/alpha crystallin family protein [Candidatus Thermoplasmatota archaeon]
MVNRKIRRRDDDFWNDIQDFLENSDREYRRFFERWFDAFDEIENIREQDQPGTYVYGFTYRLGPDGKPEFKEFGNIPREYSERAELPGLEYREPITDIQRREEETDITMEIPGVSKDDISIETNENVLTVKVDKEGRKYYKEVELDSEVLPENVKASYSNGVLDVIVKKPPTKKKEGKRIPVE